MVDKRYICENTRSSGFAIPEICFTPCHNMVVFGAKIMDSLVRRKGFVLETLVLDDCGV